MLKELDLERHFRSENKERRDIIKKTELTQEQLVGEMRKDAKKT